MIVPRAETLEILSAVEAGMLYHAPVVVNYNWCYGVDDSGVLWHVPVNAYLWSFYGTIPGQFWEPSNGGPGRWVDSAPWIAVLTPD